MRDHPTKEELTFLKKHEAEIKECFELVNDKLDWVDFKKIVKKKFKETRGVDNDWY